MKHVLKPHFLILIIIICHTFLINAQNITIDTILAGKCFEKAELFKDNSKFDSSLIYFSKASTVYLNYGLTKTYLECELKKGGLFIDKRELDNAYKILKSGMDKSIKTFGENSNMTADFYNKIGLVYVYGGKYQTGKNFWESALKIRLKVFGNKHVKVSDSYNNLGGLCIRTNEFDKSLEYHEKALRIRKKKLEKNDLKIASSYMNIGAVYTKLGNNITAIEYYNKSLQIKKMKLPAGHTGLASLYNNIAVTNYAAGEFEKSLVNYNNALIIRENNFGKNHPQTAAIYTNMALVMNSKGEYNTALEYHGRALKIYESKFNQNHPSIAKVIQDIGIVYLNKRQIDKASEYFNKALRITESVYGLLHQNTAKLITAIGVVMYENYKYDTALEYYQKALSIQKEIFGKKHPDIAESYLQIGIIYKEKKDFKTALKYYYDCLKMRKEIYKNKHPKITRIYNLIANLYDAKSDYFKELDYLQKALISNIESFYDPDVNYNPDIENDTVIYYDQTKLLKTLSKKADAFAKLYRKNKIIENLKNSYNTYQICNKLISKIKRSIVGREDKILFGKKISSIYEKAITISVQLFQLTNKAEYFYKAFEFSEKNKAGILLEALAAAEAQKFAGIPDSVLKTGDKIMTRIAFYRRKIAENPENIHAREKLFSANREYESHIIMLENKYYSYYKLKYDNELLNIKAIQNILDKNTTIISYVCTEESDFLFLFIIEKDKASIRFIKKIEDFDKKVLAFRQLYFSNKENDMKIYIKDAYMLYKQLIPDVTFNNENTDNLIIIPDSKLSIIPFETLFTQNYTSDWKSYKYYPFLIKKYNISYSYSVNLFYTTFNKDQSSNIEIRNLKDWLALAPIFDDENIKGTTIKTRAILKKTDNSLNKGTRAYVLDGNYVSFLPGSESEVNAIYNEFQKKGKRPF